MLHYNITLFKKRNGFKSIIDPKSASFIMPFTSKRSPASKTIKWIFFLGALSLLVSTRSHADNSAPIVVTIKPLYSLVAHLTEGIETPVLLMKQVQSPHHYNMRPSERRLLAKARMIVWLGPQLESYLSKIIQQQKSTLVISVIQAINLTLLDKRKKHSHQNSHHHSDTGHADLDTVDPHIWLSTHNAIAMSKQISEQLIKQDLKNADKYTKNLQHLINKIEQTDDFIKTTLHGKDAAFITFHDAFQYFENEYALNYVDSINYDEETGTSLKHLRQIKASIDENKIRCLVYQAPKPAIIDSLTRQTAAKSVALDPLGQATANDKDAWFEIMRQLALSFNHCLTS